MGDVDFLVRDQDEWIEDFVGLSIRNLIIEASSGGCAAEPVAAFLLAWHDPESYGGFRLSDLWVMSERSRQAANILFEWLSKNHITTQELGLQIVFDAIAARRANRQSL